MGNPNSGKTVGRTTGPGKASGRPKNQSQGLQNIRKGRKAREVCVEEGSGQTQAAADHKGAFKPKPLSFNLLALTSLEVEGCL